MIDHAICLWVLFMKLFIPKSCCRRSSWLLALLLYNNTAQLILLCSNPHPGHIHYFTFLSLSLYHQSQTETHFIHPQIPSHHRSPGSPFGSSPSLHTFHHTHGLFNPFTLHRPFQSEALFAYPIFDLGSCVLFYISVSLNLSRASVRIRTNYSQPPPANFFIHVVYVW